MTTDESHRDPLPDLSMTLSDASNRIKLAWTYTTSDMHKQAREEIQGAIALLETANGKSYVCETPDLDTEKVLLDAVRAAIAERNKYGGNGRTLRAVTGGQIIRALSLHGYRYADPRLTNTYGHLRELVASGKLTRTPGGNYELPRTK